MRKIPLILCAGAAVLLASGCSARPAARKVDAAEAAQPPAQVALTPVTEPRTVQVTAVGRDGKPMGEPQTVRLTPEANPAEVGLTPVPAGSR
jgi:hypothetical protein